MWPRFSSISFSIATACLFLQCQAASAKSSLSQCKSINYETESIKRAFMHAYTGYETYAWKHDELLPVSNSSSDSR